MKPEDAFREEFHGALDEVSGSTPDLMSGIVRKLESSRRRRPVFALAQATAVLAVALIVAAVVLSMHRSRVTPSPVNTAPTVPVVAGAGASNAWISSQTPEGGTLTTGIDEFGHVVGRINASVDLRSADGSHLYALGNSEVDVYSAVDGHQETAIHLQSAAGQGIDMLSADGRYMALVGGTPSMVELVDLVTGRSLAFVRLESPAYGAPLIVGAQAEHIYVVGDTVAELAFNGSSLRVERRTINHPFSCGGLALGGENSGGGLPFRVLNDARTLVAFCPGDGQVTWFDLPTMRVVHTIRNPQANPFWVSPVFSPDGNTLYLHEGGTGALAAIDLVHQRTEKSAKIAMSELNPLGWLESILVTPAYAGAIARTAAVSPDGKWLYTVGIFEAPGGVSAVHIPDLRVSARWLATTSFDSVWVSADGKTIYVLTQNGSVLRMLHTDGSQFAQLTLPAMADGFVVPSTP